MRRDSRLSTTLHALVHIAEKGRAMTSAELATCMNTNAVVVRRVMAGLRQAGIVRSQKGHGGGWEIARDLSDITFKDIYDALGSPKVLAIGVHIESPTCLIEQAVNNSLAGAFGDAEAFLVRRFADVTLAALAENYRASVPRHQNAKEKAHP